MGVGRTAKKVEQLQGFMLWFCEVLCVLLGLAPYGSTHTPPPEPPLGPSWPTHLLCKTQGMDLYYTSCDPIQDIGLSIYPCASSGRPFNLRLSLLLRCSVQTLSLSVDVYSQDGLLLHYEEALCAPGFPRFTFCERRKGEILLMERRVPNKHALPHGISAVVSVSLLNQDGCRTACLNITMNNTE